MRTFFTDNGWEAFGEWCWTWRYVLAYVGAIGTFVWAIWQ